MRDLDWESTITRGRAQWMASLIHDSAGEFILFRMIGDPEQPHDYSVWRISDVRHCKSTWFDRDDASLESLIGFDVRIVASELHGVIHTDQREVLFHSRKNAVLCLEREGS